MLISTNTQETSAVAFEALCPGQPAASAPATRSVPLSSCIPSANISVPLSLQCLLSIRWAHRKALPSAVAPAGSMPVLFIPLVKFRIIPLLYFNQMPFFFPALSFRMRFWNHCLKQSLHLLGSCISIYCRKSRWRGSRKNAVLLSVEFCIPLSSQFVYLYFHLLPTSLKIFELIGPLKFLCLFSCCQIKVWLPKIYSQPWRFPTLGTCAEGASEFL